jgi:hypothetical protein
MVNRNAACGDSHVRPVARLAPGKVAKPQTLRSITAEQMADLARDVAEVCRLGDRDKAVLIGNSRSTNKSGQPP